MKAAQKAPAQVSDKVVAHRRTATQMLKKVGIAQADYAKFIGEVEGKFIVELTAAVRSLQKPAKAKKVAKAASEPKETLAGTIRSMVITGMTNEEIRESLQLPDNKRHYPAWYRAEMARKQAADVVKAAAAH